MAKNFLKFAIEFTHRYIVPRKISHRYIVPRKTLIGLLRCCKYPAIYPHTHTHTYIYIYIYITLGSSAFERQLV